MKTGVAAVALAASALLATAPAHAQSGDRFRQDRSTSDLRGGPAQGFRDFGRNDRRDVRVNHAGRGHGKVPLNRFGQTPKEAKYLAAEAIEACVCQLEIDAYKYGFKDAGFHGTPYLEQISRNRFIVKGSAKLYDGYDYSKQSYECVVRKGKIKDASRLYPAAVRKSHDRGRGGRFGQAFGVSFSFGQAW